ncbi:hypothetical protein B0J11DRAFT_516140 [Dendryphion nanum]|uniref:C3H1-type domain-containing protein n=1 Tax=Dendryphion nanum TaxID=256645 RepID=A0A9P9EL69_9PLEO|nr:hypothetical protein B0J11DRAFT_516140 [Dendryphion nanum]
MTTDSGNRTQGSLWDRFTQIKENDQQKSNFIEELIIRYEYISQQYENKLRQIQSYETSFQKNPFIVVLIDGDGVIFKDEYIRIGEDGGRKAAAELYKTIQDCIQEGNAVASQVSIVCRVYAHAEGLANVLTRSGVVSHAEIVTRFFRGFTLEKALFDFVDVGPGKDRADKKIIESFKLYLDDFSCRKIFFGCSHDNGYARVLEDYTDDLSISRVTLIGGVPFEKELIPLPFQKMVLSNIFRNAKILVPGAPCAVAPGANGPQVRRDNNTKADSSLDLNAYEFIGRHLTPLSGFSHWQKPSHSNRTLDSPNPALMEGNPRKSLISTICTNDGLVAKTAPVMSWAAKAAATPVAAAKSSVEKSMKSSTPYVAHNRSRQRVDPLGPNYDKTEVERIRRMKLCNVHFLRKECPFGRNCTHIHDYEPSNDELSTLLLITRMEPCINGSGCDDAKCIYGHLCPLPCTKNGIKGAKMCILGEKCKFPQELHGIDCRIVKTMVIR